jgi:2-(1,2-epoxy-1,2-dihydrophenyl)acetyl-CoA isomerase
VNSDRSALAKQLYEALATGDRAVLGEILAPDFVGSTTAGLPLGLGGTFKSAEEMQRDFWWRIGKAYKARAEPESFEPLGDDRLLVSGTYRGTARATARPLEARFVKVPAPRCLPTQVHRPLSLRPSSTRCGSTSPWSG